MQCSWPRPGIWGDECQTLPMSGKIRRASCVGDESQNEPMSINVAFFLAMLSKLYLSHPVYFCNRYGRP